MALRDDFIENKMISNKGELNPKRWTILSVVLLGPFMATLDSSIVNVALPNMAIALHVGISSIQWVVTIYLIVISSLILIFGRMADLIGKSKVFKNGFLIFSVGSLFCGLSFNIAFLVISRIIQAIGAAMILACNQGILTDVFPINERGRALGLSGTVVALGTMIGPPLGGILVGFFRWEVIFLINVPIGIFAYVYGSRILESGEVNVKGETFDKFGAVLFFIGIITLFASLLNGETIGWLDLRIILGFILSITCFIIFYRWEKKIDYPILDFSLFNNRLYTLSIFCAFISFMAIFCTNIIHPFYLQYVLGISPAKAGILMIIFPISVVFVAPLSGYMSDKIGSQILTLLGLITTVLGLILLSFLNENSTYLNIIISIGIVGIGNGLFQSPNNAIIMSLAAKEKLGIAGSINALTRNLGMVFGIVISIALLYYKMSAKIGYNVQSYVVGRPDVFIYAMKFIYLTAAAVCSIGVMLTFIRMVGNVKKIK